MSFIAYDNRGLGVGYGFGSYSGTSSFETESGIALYNNLGSRTIVQCFGLQRENFRDQTWGIFVPQSPESMHLSLFNDLKLGDLISLLASRCDIPTSFHSLDSWRGIMASILAIIKFRKHDILALSCKTISLFYITNDVALFGGFISVEALNESVGIFKGQLEELRDQLKLTINCDIVCTNVSVKSTIIDRLGVDDLICSTTKLLGLNGLKSDRGEITLTKIENSSIHFESLRRRIFHRSQPVFNTILEFPRTPIFKGSLHIQLAAASMDGLLSVKRQSFTDLQVSNFLPSNGINPLTIAGSALIVRPAILESPARNQNNKLVFIALCKMLNAKESLILLKTSVIPISKFGESTADCSLEIKQFWVMIPFPSTDIQSCGQMTMLKLIDSDDLLQDKSTCFESPILTTQEEDAQVLEIQTLMSGSFFGDSNSSCITTVGPFTKLSYNPLANPSSKIDCLLELMKRGDAKSSRFLSPSYTGERPGYTAPSSVSAISKSYGQKEIYTYPPANFTAAQHSKKASYETEGRSKNPVVTIQDDEVTVSKRTKTLNKSFETIKNHQKPVVVGVAKSIKLPMTKRKKPSRSISWDSDDDEFVDEP